MEDSAKVRCREHLANERTFLAWIRTSIGIIIFGFVIQRFSFFLKEMALFIGSKQINGIPSQREETYTRIFGICLVAFGALISLLAYFSFKKTQKQIDAAQYASSSLFALLPMVVVVASGIILVIYLLL